MPGKKSITVSNELLNIYINWTRKHSSRISTARFCGPGGGRMVRGYVLAGGMVLRGGGVVLQSASMELHLIILHSNILFALVMF